MLGAAGGKFFVVLESKFIGGGVQESKKIAGCGRLKKLQIAEVGKIAG